MDRNKKDLVFYVNVRKKVLNPSVNEHPQLIQQGYLVTQNKQ